MKMVSNISFKSNIYPAIHNDDKNKFEKWVCYSDAYLAKVTSREKMDQIREKQILRSLPRFWTETQALVFSSMKHNPYIGIIIKDNEYTIVKNDNIPKANFIRYDPSEYNPGSINKRIESYKQFLTPIITEDYSPDSVNEERLEKSTFSGTPNVEIKSILEIISHREDTTETDEDRFSDISNEETPVVSLKKERISELDSLGNIFNRFIETEQSEIIETDPDQVIFVDAGPGTGKTYALIERIQYMVEICDVPANEIQVLSFTNAAVNEIRERLNKIIKNGGDRSLANVDIRTFHSFAWWLIAQANAQRWHTVNMHNLSFDQSIKIASRILSNHLYYPQVVGNWRHFLVDEIQDLTNYLARFVLYIINACLDNKIGITVLGDSCQAIYDYTMNDEKEAPMSSQDFYNALVRKTDDIGLYMSMSKNHRQIDSLSVFTEGFRKAILSQSIEIMQKEVVDISKRIKRIEGNDLLIADDMMIDKIRDNNHNHKICFMCRNNGQTLKLSSVFRKKGIDHILNFETTENNYAAWISDLFYNYEKKYIVHDDFISKYNTFIGAVNSKDPEEIWQKILYLTKSDGYVFISDFLRAVGSSKIDDTCFRHTNVGSNVLVSNIHRTKGREYDHVIVDQAFVNDLIERKLEIGEYKTLYVALTRPKSSLFSAQLSESIKNQGVYKILIFKTKRSRFGRMKNEKVFNFELLSNLDICIESYLDKKIQSYLKNIGIGDPIRLKRQKENGRIVYNILHTFEDRATVIGKLEDTFKDDLSARMKLSDSDYINLPDTITDLYVSGKYTYIATEDYLKTHPEIIRTSPNGVWQWVEFIGIGYASYDTY